MPIYPVRKIVRALNTAKRSAEFIFRRSQVSQLFPRQRERLGRTLIFLAAIAAGGLIGIWPDNAGRVSKLSAESLSHLVAFPASAGAEVDAQALDQLANPDFYSGLPVGKVERQA